jgi:hypothetical protein
MTAKKEMKIRIVEKMNKVNEYSTAFMSLSCCLLAELTTTYLYRTVVIISLVLPNFETTIYLILLGS